MKPAHLIEKTKGGLGWFLEDDLLITARVDAVRVRGKPHFLPENPATIKGRVQGNLRNTSTSEFFFQHLVKECSSAGELVKYRQITNIRSVGVFKFDRSKTTVDGVLHEEKNHSPVIQKGKEAFGRSFRKLA